MCRRDDDRVHVFSRNAKDWTDKVPAIVEAVRALPVKSVTIDGEGVVCDDRGVTDFERLRSALARGGSPAAFLYGFDLLELDGEDLRRHPWEIRRATLTGFDRASTPQRFKLTPLGCDVFAALIKPPFNEQDYTPKRRKEPGLSPPGSSPVLGLIHEWQTHSWARQQ